MQNNQQNLANSLSTLGAGLAPYIQISQWGQWFAVETIYTCLANQTVCPYYQPSNPPAGSGPFGSPPLPAPLSGVTTPGLPNPDARAGSSSSASNTAAGGSGAPNLDLDLQAVSGAARGGHGSVEVKAVTERNPKVVGLVAIVVMAVCILAILFLNRSLFSSGYTVTRASPTRRASPRAPR